MRLLHLLWPHLPLRLAKARAETPSPGGTSASWPPGPIVLGGMPWTDGTVVDADPLARALGVRRGIPLGSAHRLAPEAAFLDPELEPYLRSGQLAALLGTLREGIAYAEAVSAGSAASPGPTPGPLPMLVGMLAAIGALAEAAFRRLVRRRGRRPRSRRVPS